MIHHQSEHKHKLCYISYQFLHIHVIHERLVLHIKFCIRFNFKSLFVSMPPLHCSELHLPVRQYVLGSHFLSSTSIDFDQTNSRYVICFRSEYILQVNSQGVTPGHGLTYMPILRVKFSSCLFQQ